MDPILIYLNFIPSVRSYWREKGHVQVFSFSGRLAGLPAPGHRAGLKNEKQLGSWLRGFGAAFQEEKAACAEEPMGHVGQKAGRGEAPPRSGGGHGRTLNNNVTCHLST